MPTNDEIHKQTLKVYDTHALAYDQQRSKILFEKPWLDKFIARLPPGGKVLDLGCGSGQPISEYLINQGFDVTGIDASKAMLDLCRSRLPDSNWIQMDMRELELNTQFNGIISWWSFFHLNQDEQRQAIPLFNKHLNPGGSLILTIGHISGEAIGTVAGKEVYHSSLDADEYRNVLESLGFDDIEIKLQDESCGQSSILLASKNHGTD